MNIGDIVYYSFSKQIDYADAFTASDFHYILTTILEAPPREEKSSF